MISCYLLAVCQGSSLDRDTNNVTLFAVVEHVQVIPDALGQLAPLETHIHIEATGEDIGRSIEFRVVWRDEDGLETVGDSVVPINLANRRNRVRSPIVRLPPRTGHSRLYAEWRVPGDGPWTRFSAFWPLELSLLDPQSIPVKAAAQT